MNKYSKLLVVFILFFPYLIGFSNIYFIETDLENITEKHTNSIVLSYENEEKFFKEIIAEQFGDQRDFWTRNFEIQEYEQVHATLLAVGNWCYLYMDNRTIDQLGQSQAIQMCESYVDEFDNNIYPKNVEFMGHPDGIFGDIDGDPRITILIYPAVRGGGYYLEGNEMDHAYSNFREMIYINSAIISTNLITTVCHEFNHLILFNNDLNEADFVIEGMAEYSIYHVGYFSNESYLPPWARMNLSYNAIPFENQPETSLLYFDPSAAYLTYGASYMFFFYLVEQYGIQVITDLLGFEADGPEGIEQTLLLNGVEIEFNQLFLNWITACTIDQLGFENNLYGFENADFQVSVNTVINDIPFSKTDVNHKLYGFDVKKLNSPPDRFFLEMQTPLSHRALGISAVILDDNGWNITKTIISGADGEFVTMEYSGDNIQEAYILTSLIKEGIKEAPREFMVAPFENLDYSFSEEPTTNVSDFSFETFTILIVFMSSLIVFVRRRIKI